MWLFYWYINYSRHMGGSLMSNSSILSLENFLGLWCQLLVLFHCCIFFFRYSIMYMLLLYLCSISLFRWSFFYSSAAATAKSLQSCPTLCNLIDGSPPGSPIPGILQARTLEWVAISFSNAWKWKVKVKSLSCVQLLVTPWTPKGNPIEKTAKDAYYATQE